MIFLSIIVLRIITTFFLNNQQTLRSRLIMNQFKKQSPITRDNFAELKLSLFANDAAIRVNPNIKLKQKKLKQIHLPSCHQE